MRFSEVARQPRVARTLQKISVDITVKVSIIFACAHKHFHESAHEALKLTSVVFSVVNLFSSIIRLPSAARVVLFRRPMIGSMDNCMEALEAHLA